MKLLFSLTSLFLLICSTALAYDNEPNGFKGLKWGTSIEEFKNVYPNATLQKQQPGEYNPANIITYIVPINESKLSGITITSPFRYSFYNNKLESVLVTFTGKDNYETLNKQKILLNRMSMIYGEINESSGNNIDEFIPGLSTAYYNFNYCWKGTTTTINLNGSYKEPNLSSYLSISISSVEIRKQWLSKVKPIDKTEWSKIRKNIISEYRSDWWTEKNTSLLII